MKRLLTLVLGTVVGNAIALIVAGVALRKVSVGVTGFFSALVIFTILSVVGEPIIRSLAKDRAPAIVGLSALIATLISLFVTNLLTNGLRIHGSLTWLLAALIVWIVSAVLRLVIVKALTGEAVPHSDPN